MNDRAPAPEQLVDGDEWSSVVATRDYVGQRAERFEMADVEVRGGRWSGVTIEGLRAFQVTFDGCDLAGFVLQESPTLQNVVFRRCRMSGAVLAGARLRDVRFEECSLDDANLRMIDAERVTLSGCALVAADLHGAQIASAQFARCDLRGADFTKARLRDVDLRSSEVTGLRGAGTLRGATIDSAQVIALAHSLAAAVGVRVVDDDE